MVKYNFDVQIYGFKIEVAELSFDDSKDKIVEVLEENKLEKEDIEEIVKKIDRESYNGADTFANFSEKRFLIIVYPCKTSEDRREIINHEKRHVEDRILEHCGINDIEAAGYLAGFLSKYLY